MLAFTQYTFPGYLPGWVHREICRELDEFLAAVIRKESPRLLLFMPPQHGKTELISRRFPAYALGRYPDLSIIATSYGASLAARANRDVQRIIDSEEYRQLFPGTCLWGRNVRAAQSGAYLRNSDIFEVVDHKGVYRSAGVGGGITGMGFDIGIIDDPIKDAAQAYSQTYRDNLWEWYLQVFSTRIRPGAGILGIWTRWHLDDLAGRLFAQEQGSPLVHRWKVIRYPAIAEEDEKHRRIGEALHPERYSLDDLIEIKAGKGSAWQSLYQQNPVAAAGNIFKREWWQYYRELPPLKRKIQSWDTAFETKTQNDFSCCTTWGEGEAGYYCLNRWKERVEFPELETMVMAMAERDNPNAILIEKKASGASLIQNLRRKTKLPVIPVEVDKDKVFRASLITPLMEAGKVFLPAPGTPGASWVADYLDSMSAFPAGAHDDDVDSTTQALNYLARKGEVRVRWL
jgi:predicted phage terminase large subunit-like protein